MAATALITSTLVAMSELSEGAPCADDARITMSALVADVLPVQRPPDELVLHENDQVLLQAELQGCTVRPDFFVWSITEGFLGNESAIERKVVTDSPRLEHHFERLGEYWITVDAHFEDGSTLAGRTNGQLWQVLVNLAVTPPIPQDGSVFTYPFETLCCPGVTEIHVLSDGSPFNPQQWGIRVVVDGSGALVVEDVNGNGWGPQPYEDAVGAYVVERFRIEVEALDPEPASLPGINHVEIRIGPLANHLPPR